MTTYGVMEQVVSDRGSEFISGQFNVNANGCKQRVNLLQLLSQTQLYLWKYNCVLKYIAVYLSLRNFNRAIAT